jgi:hypothetical protein
MPVQLLLLFLFLAAIDLACQLLGACLVHSVPAGLRDAARLCGALLLSVAAPGGGGGLGSLELALLGLLSAWRWLGARGSLGSASKTRNPGFT